MFQIRVSLQTHIRTSIDRLQVKAILLYTLFTIRVEFTKFFFLVGDLKYKVSQIIRHYLVTSL